MDPHSCQHCANFVLFDPEAKHAEDSTTWKEALERQQALRREVAQAMITEQSLHSDRLGEKETHLERFVLFKFLRKDLDCYVADGCQLYKMIREAAYRSFGKKKETPASVVVAVKALVWCQFFICPDIPLALQSIETRMKATPEGLKFDYIDFSTGSDWYIIFTAKDDPASPYCGYTSPNMHPSSDEAFETAARWLKECCDTHPDCAVPASEFRPTRLIEIASRYGRRALRLIHTTLESHSAPYAALSYCWGGPQKFQTTRHSLRRHLTSITFNDLPATFQHAIQVAERLDLRYLWVDALCIVQDDEHDKAREIDRMSYIYSHARVTILASRASRVKEGFLHDRLRFGRERPEEAFKLPYLCPDGRVGSINLVSRFVDPIEPLSTRAWAFQERLLSPRILDFGTNLTQWACQSSCHQDGFILQPGSDDFGFPTQWIGQIDPSSHASEISLRPKSDGFDILWNPKTETIIARKGPPGTRTPTHFDIWNTILEQYRSRSLTFAEDRLPAIAGIAEMIGRNSQDQYVAGLWRSCLPMALLWVNAPSSTHKDSGQDGPSWSWASVNCTDTPRTLVRPDVDSDIAEVLDVTIELHEVKSKFGRVKSGLLRIQGPLLHATARGKLGDAISAKYIAGHAKSSLLTAFHSLDVSPLTEFPVSLLFIAKANIDRKHCNSAGLILDRHLDGTYSRIGAFFTLEGPSNWEWLGEIPVESITIK